VSGWLSAFGQVNYLGMECNQPPRSTGPDHPSVGRRRVPAFDNVEMMWNAVKSKLLEGLNRYIPSTTPFSVWTKKLNGRGS